MLVERYQYIIGATVSRFITRGFFDASEKNEIIQAINLQLLEGKMDKIRDNFNGSVYLSTYFSKVVYNSCLEMVRSRSRKPTMVSDELLEFKKGNDLEIEKSMLIADEFMRLEAILKGFRRRNAKLLFCLKLYARKLITSDDLNELSSAEGMSMNVKDFPNTFSNDYDNLNDKEVYGLIVPFINKMENKNADADSLRKWLNMQIDKIIDLLNGEPPTSSYQRNTLRILLDFYFNQKKS